MLPKRFPDRVEVASARGEAEKAEAGETLDQELRVAGRVMARREMGKLTFLDLVDRSGVPAAASRRSSRRSSSCWRRSAARFRTHSTG